MTSDPDLFAGTAYYDARYRQPYPDALYDDVIRDFDTLLRNIQRTNFEKR